MKVEAPESLKLINSPYIVLYIVWCFAVLAACMDSPTEFVDAIANRFDSFNAKDGIVIALSPLLSLVTSGLLSQPQKETLVFWRLQDVLPGHRAFSVYAENDPRVDMSRLRAAVPNWPSTPRDENTVWYSLYRQHEKAVSVRDANRLFLLGRDLTACTAVLFFIGTGAVWAFGESNLWAGIFSAIMIVQFILLAVAARRNGERLVLNVLAEVSNSAANE